MDKEREKSFNLSESFGVRLRKLRRQKNLSQAVFAKSLGISQGYLSDLERGNKHPSDTLLIALDSRYGVGGGPRDAAGATPAGLIPLLAAIDTEQHADGVPGVAVDQLRLPQVVDGQFALVAVGNFMAPTICAGDLVILTPASEVVPGEVVLLTNQWGEAILRRYRIKGGAVLYSPDNSSYKPFHPDGETRVLATVVAVWRSVLH